MPNILVKINGNAEKQTIDKIQALYTAFHRGLPFDYYFLDDEYRVLYSSENRVATLSKYFAGLAIIISCLGLFGLVAFTAQRRRKEIGIRKVIGASVPAVVFMLSKDFLKLVVIAMMVAFPVVWRIMSGWLNQFAYRIDIGGGIFFVTALAMLMITLVTISSQAIRAALANPVNSLRSE